MGMECRLGRMGLSMRGTGWGISQMVWGSYYILMVPTTRESGEIRRLTGMECTSRRVVPCTRESGGTICRRVKDRRYGPIVLVMKGSICRGRNMDREPIIGKMAHNIRETGIIIRSVER
jgi:hypothetical protein